MKTNQLHIFASLFILISFSLIFNSCVHKATENPAIAQSNFPPEVAEIMITKCAIAGCHNQASYGNADSLLLDSWEHLFKGGNVGAVVVPFSPAYSTLLYYVNTNLSLGRMYQPLMPYSTANRPLPALSREEYQVLYDWIKVGALDNNGNIAFASDAETRQKTYLIHGSCDNIVGVIDTKTGLLMRVIQIGDSLNGESGHSVRVSPDGMYAYVSTTNYDALEKIDTRTDKVISRLDLTYYGNKYGSKWADIKISDDGSQLMMTDNNGSGGSLLVNTNNMSVAIEFPALINPHGVTANATFDTFFVTAQLGNSIYVLADSYRKAMNIVDSGVSIISTDTSTDLPDPHDIIMSPDYSKLFITCQKKNEVQVLDAHTMRILNSILVGIKPQDMAMSRTHPYIFVTCMLDNAIGGGLGSVYVINYNTMKVVKVLYNQFYAPHGITVDDLNGILYIASSNYGGTNHHPTTCGTANGWYNAYDLKTLNPIFGNKRFDIFSYPYAMDIRFK